MSAIGSLFMDEGEVHGVYVVLKTKLGYLAVSIVDGSTYGGLQRTIHEATNGLMPMGYKLDIDKTATEGRQFQY